ncbi:MAG TPA: LuxR C-terminal-related transcriptional regulator [Melioribacteraceae bacterium]|nr:LuxR C-terminal-related transcriptional regulator [Melioribacteraceae bacterium]
MNHEEIANNNLNFSKFEKEIMELICNGYKNKEISKLLELALSVLEEIISEIYKKLGAKNRANAVYLICKYKIL